MTETLILGNGISRLSYVELINNWPGEVWGSNRAYLDFPKKITRLTGHLDVMKDAREYRKKNQCNFEIWGGHLGDKNSFDNHFDCPSQFRKDSGITLVAQALHEDKNVSVCGFDLGGPDIHSPGLENHLKHNWVQRWRKLFEVYDHNRVTFIGYDHKPYLFSGRSSMQYSQRYRDNRPHIIDIDYLKIWKKWTGRDYKYLGGEIVKVKYKKNGYVATVSEAVAAKLIDKGKVELVKEKKEAPKTDVLTRKEIIAKLVELKIDFDKKAKVADLLALLEEAEK